MRRGRGAAVHVEQNGQEGHVLVPRSSLCLRLVARNCHYPLIVRALYPCIHIYAHPRAARFSRPAPPSPAQPVPSNPISSRYSLSRSPAGAACKPQASFLHQRPLPGKLLAAFLRGGMPNTRLHLPGCRPSPPRAFCTASACHMLVGRWLACRKMQGRGFFARPLWQD